MRLDYIVGRCFCVFLGHWPALVRQPCRCRSCGRMIEWDGKGGWRDA